MAFISKKAKLVLLVLTSMPLGACKEEEACHAASLVEHTHTQA